MTTVTGFLCHSSVILWCSQTVASYSWTGVFSYSPTAGNNGLTIAKYGQTVAKYGQTVACNGQTVSNNGPTNNLLVKLNVARTHITAASNNWNMKCEASVPQ